MLTLAPSARSYPRSCRLPPPLRLAFAPSPSALLRRWFIQAAFPLVLADIVTDNRDRARRGHSPMYPGRSAYPLFISMALAPARPVYRAVMGRPTLGAPTLHRHSSNMLRCPYRATERVLVSCARRAWYSRSRAVVPCSPSSSRSARGWGVPREDGAFPLALRAGAIPASLHHNQFRSSCPPAARRIPPCPTLRASPYGTR